MRICLVSRSVIGDDPRVRRQGDALLAGGHDVVGVGLGPSTSEPTPWETVELPGGSRTLRVKAREALLSYTGGRSGQAERAYWAIDLSRRFREAVSKIDADLYIANDWPVLPVVASVATERSARYAYDSHELALEEGGDRRLWRMIMPRYVRALEGTFIRGAAFVSTVGDGIADVLQTEYHLDRRPLVVRNIPSFQQMPYRHPKDTLTVVYHGIYGWDRCLLELIESVDSWRPEFRLILRGFGKPPIERAMRKAGAAAVATGRITFAERVPMLDLVRSANEADIGIFATPGTTRHTQFCLPNKVFEYLMAGLGLCVSDNAEMGPLVRRFEVGRLIEEPTAAGIARAINGFSIENVAEYKRRALEAATQLCWEKEQSGFVDAVEACGTDDAERAG
jgi:glycogen(starch) synthase